MPPVRLQLPHCYRELDPAVRREIVDHAAADGFPLSGVLYRPPETDPDVAILAMHPRVDFTRHYLVPYLVEGGYAFFGATTRYLNHDADALHERLLIDVAGSIAWLREQGFRTVVLLGNSGGGALSTFYLEQAAKDPQARYQRAPSGDPVPLHETAMPMADGLVLLAAHLGEGRFLLDRLDPSVIDEDDPIATNPALDMYDPANGYRPMHEGRSSYSADFLAEYRAAQRARCERLDARALAWCEEVRWHRKRLGAIDQVAKLPQRERAWLSRCAFQRRYFLIYRTLADPRNLDPTLDPSQRPLGSIFSFGRDPIVGNYGEGLARMMSGRGWLSTWSGLSSRASLERTLPFVRVPTLVICPLADLDIYPSECRAAYEWSGAEDKQYAEIPWAGHYLYPAGVEGASLPHPQERCARDVLLPWLRERWSV
jgi:pimeloyl-ACP methyl ester carboxylesterase